MWPAINRGLNVVAIGDGTSGKSIGYLAPLASKHLDMTLQREVSIRVFWDLLVKFNFCYLKGHALQWSHHAGSVRHGAKSRVGRVKSESFDYGESTCIHQSIKGKE